MERPKDCVANLCATGRAGPGDPCPHCQWPRFGCAYDGTPGPLPRPSGPPGYDEPPTVSSRAGEMLRQAAGIVDGARNVTHGEKERSFAAIASLWTAYLQSRRIEPNQLPDITAADVAAMMVLLKFARSSHGQHVADHGVDAAGYAAIWGELREAGR